MGCSGSTAGRRGRIENCQIGVFLAYASARGRTLLDRELYLPQVWAEDWERRREAGKCRRVSAFGPSRNWPSYMLKRALESGVPCGLVAGDEVYGNDGQAAADVAGARGNSPRAGHQEQREAVGLDGPGLLCQVRADRLTSQVDELGWTRCSAGDGAKGPRSTIGPSWKYGLLGSRARATALLARRSIAKPGELAYFVCFGPAGTALED